MILSAQTAIALIDNIRNDFTSDLDKTILAATAHRLYDKAVRIAANQYAKTHDPQALNKAFDAAERSHARIVLDGLLAVQAERQLPERNRIRLSQLKAEVNKLSKRLWETPINDPSVSMLRNELATVQDRLQTVLSDLDKQNTAFAQRKSPAKPPVTLDNIRSTLDDATTTMVSYFLSEKTIYAFVISRNGSELLPLPRPKNLNGTIENLRLTLDSAANSSNIAPFAVRYADLAVKLYNDLLRSPLTHLATPPHRLIIIPDGTLAYIPFDALLAQKPAKSKDFRSLPYIVRDYAISYAASATLRDAQIRLPRSAPRAEKLFVGYGTSFSKTAVLADVHLSPTEQAALHSSANAVTEDDLPTERQAVRQIAQLLRGDTVWGSDATESHFKKYANQYTIVHLSTHGKADTVESLYSKLLFSQPFLDKNNDNALTAAEVYDLPMPHTALVFLSACETGFGSIADGEGVMSLSRAFAMSGVPTTVTTLWDIPTVAASDIFPLFYQYILAGKTPDEALRQAKSDYLQSALFVAGGNPLNWAGFVPYGDMARLPIPTITDDTPLSISPKIYWLVGILLTAAAAALLTVFRERIKSFFPKK